MRGGRVGQRRWPRCIVSTRESRGAGRRRPGAAHAWGSPLVVDVGRLPYPVMNTLLDDGLPDGGPQLLAFAPRADLPDAAARPDGRAFRAVPSPMTAIILEHFHGAVTRVGGTDTAVPHRQDGWNIAHPVGLDESASDRRERRLDAGDPPCAGPPRGPHAGSTTSATTRPPTWCRRPTGPTTTACSSQAPLRPGQRLPPQPEHRPELSQLGKKNGAELHRRRRLDLITLRQQRTKNMHRPTRRMLLAAAACLGLAVGVQAASAGGTAHPGLAGLCRRRLGAGVRGADRGRREASSSSAPTTRSGPRSRAARARTSTCSRSTPPSCSATSMPGWSRRTTSTRCRTRSRRCRASATSRRSRASCATARSTASRSPSIRSASSTTRPR